MSEASQGRLQQAEADLRVLREEAQFLRTILTRCGDAIITTDTEGRVTEWAGGAKAILGWGREEMLGQPLGRIYADPAQAQQLARATRSTGRPQAVELPARTHSGDHLWLNLTVSILVTSDGQDLGTVWVGRDVTRRRKLEQDLRRLSITDGLTGLFNQTRFYEVLEVEKERAIRLEHPLSLLLFDLDKFKEYNDSQGHTAGDDALRRVARVIFRSIRKEVDSGYRYGGDEFTVILPGASVTTGQVFAERLRQGIEQLQIGDVTASMGLAQYQPHERRRYLVDEADAAMYEAKRLGGNQVVVWQPDLAGDTEGGDA